MKRYALTVLICLPFCALLFQACQNCCTDPLVVKIPNNDATPPSLRWEVAVLSQTPSGPISSMNMYTEAVTNISVKTTDKVDVYLVARDDESGIKKASMKGGFGYTCIPPGGGTAIAVDGFVPERSMDFSMLTTCGLKEWKIALEALNVSLSCPNNGALSGAMIGITGNGENFKGGTSSLTLNVNVTQ
ncbi:MAG: hypothetical protein KIS77_07985 [Saprospiraceae bacterium]|nr:hypothetical protein [Saprospiraceae bacterium]